MVGIKASTKIHITRNEEILSRDSCFQSFKKTSIDLLLNERKISLEFFHNIFFLSGQKTLATSVQLLVLCLSSCSNSTLKEEIVIKPEMLSRVGSLSV